MKAGWFLVMVAALGGLAVVAPGMLKPGAGSATEPRITGVVDSAIPREEALQRFRQGLLPLDSLEGGAPSQEALVRAFVSALEQADTASLQRLLLSRREFTWVYYPTTPQGLPPYDLSPDLMWFLLEGGSRKGLSKLLAERAGRPLAYLGLRCDSLASREGENTVVGPCGVLRRRAARDTVAERLFGLMIQRRGQWKFVSYSNQLD